MAARTRASPACSARSRGSFFEILLPFLATSAFVFVYRALQAPPEYIGFVVLGGAMTAFWLNVIWMMASQLWWEKSQGNLELYFAAPMSIMSVLFGMAVGGMVMSSTRAVVVLVIASVLYGVQFAVEQWVLLLVVFLLTLAALYGLGMMLASLFLMWGREAFHLTQLLHRAGVLRVRPQLPGRAPRASSARWRSATIPLAVGLDAMRQLAFVGLDVPDRHAAARGRGADPRRDDRRLPRCRPLDAPDARADGPPGGPAVGALAMTAARHARPAPTRVPAGLASPEWGGFDPRARPRPGRPRITGGPSGRRSRLGWQMEANWTDPVLFFIYSVAKPLSAALILVVMLDIISGGTDPAYRAFVVVGTALWAIVLAGIAGLAWSILDDRERYRMLKYVVRQPERLPRHAARPRRRAAGGRGDGRRHHDRASGCCCLGVPFDPAAVDWPLLVVRRWSSGSARSSRSACCSPAICLQTRQESWSYPEAVAGALFLVSGVVFPLSVLPIAGPGASASLTPLTWWIEGVRRAVFPDGAVVDRRRRKPVDRPSPGPPPRTPRRSSSPCWRPGRWLHSPPPGSSGSSERRAKERGLLDQTTGS